MDSSINHYNNIHLNTIKLKLPRFSDPYIKYVTIYTPKKLDIFELEMTDYSNFNFGWCMD